MLDNINFRSTCPVSSVMDIIGDKWSLIIIRDLFLDRNTYSEFLKSPEGIATNILVDRLKKLTSYGLISYFKNLYSNTNIGSSVIPIYVNQKQESKFAFINFTLWEVSRYQNMLIILMPVDQICLFSICRSAGTDYSISVYQFISAFICFFKHTYVY